MKTRTLAIVQEALKRARKANRGKRIKYAVPSLWSGLNTISKRSWVDPFEYYLSVIKKIEKAGKGGSRTKSKGGDWTRTALVYNLFVRTTTAFDHDGNGKLDLPLNRSGFRETGTFLKSIAFLPYLKLLGVDTLHLLPITSIGKDGNKGTLGSPYAIRNSYEIEESLAEPILGLDAGTEFKAFVEAAHCLGFRVVLEFVFRTAAKDSDWIKEHPEWFYWIREEVELRENSSVDENKYGSPFFTREELEGIHADVHEKRFGALIPPHKVYQDFFKPPPPKESIRMVNGRYRGVLSDGQMLKIPGAFADWPPDDSQPPWGDVTYLKMYDHPDFNYMAYNTIRMYDSRLNQSAYANTTLWDKIAGTIPHYQKNFGIDGVMVDMGHALPMTLKKSIIASAREIDPGFAFWDEDFSISQRSRDEGYNAVVGFLWMDEHHRDRMHSFVAKCASQKFPIAFFAGAETHNTPRAASRPGGTRFSAWSWVINCFLPGVAFLHSGFELGETLPINTGLDFTPAELAMLPAEKLPLFSEHAYSWISPGKLVDLVARVSEIRKRYIRIIADPNPNTFGVLACGNPAIIAFARMDVKRRRRIAIVTNSDFGKREKASVHLDSKKHVVMDLLSAKKIHLRSGTLSVILKPGQCLIFEY